MDAGVDVDATFDALADETEGFSGREIEKLFVAVQAIAYGSGGVLDLEMLKDVASHKVSEHRRKRAMNDDGDAPAAAPAAPARAWITDAQAGLDPEGARPDRRTGGAEVVSLFLEDESPRTRPGAKSLFLDEDDESCYDVDFLNDFAPTSAMKSPRRRNNASRTPPRTPPRTPERGLRAGPERGPGGRASPGPSPKTP